MTHSLSQGFLHRIGCTPIQDEHHWFFPWSDFKLDALALEFRTISCARTMMDYDVHRALHHLYYIRLSGKNQGGVSRKHMRNVVEKHRAGACGCYQPSLVTKVNVFHLADTNFGSKIGEPLPSCCFVRLDSYVAKLVRTHYAYRRRRFESLPLAEIVAEHELGRCACGPVQQRRRQAA